VTARAVATAFLVAAAAAPARAEEPPARFTFEAIATAATSVVHDVGKSSVGFRVGVGAELPSSSAGIAAAGPARLLVTGAWANGLEDGGVGVDELRLGVGARLAIHRWGIGADVEWVRLTVDQVTTSGRLAGSGLGARLLGSLDVVHVGDVSVVLSLEFALAAIGTPGSSTYVPSAQAGLGFRY